jgi:hypothetical protein
VASGFDALLKNTTGGGNTANGFEALYCGVLWTKKPLIDGARQLQ